MLLLEQSSYAHGFSVSHVAFYVSLFAMVMVSLLLMWVSCGRKNRVYLMDYACVKYPDDQGKITSEVVSYFLPGKKNSING